jgi:hypothetical protein
MKHVVRHVAHWALLAHIYISMAGLTLAVLFGLTGLALNHQDFGFSNPRITKSEVVLDKSHVAHTDQAAIEDHLREDGTAEIEKESRGLLGRLGDLHKGFDSGRVWYWTIDIAALLIVVSSMTGIVTLMALRHRRRLGFTIGALGVLTVLVIYEIWVPK